MSRQMKPFTFEYLMYEAVAIVMEVSNGVAGYYIFHPPKDTNNPLFLVEPNFIRGGFNTLELAKAYIDSFENLYSIGPIAFPSAELGGPKLIGYPSLQELASNAKEDS